ncbi:hypothetical protein IV203_028100 [Nitzschia inconspicua]|uniref:Uncharacterized protein n=1 Tax=Nitzschia inconspicua TaxID=303405 RepID=A0A9K3LXK4_9STRA|nr:hypothetical protein IV203_028100 [Nitzschia inconspicua]
MVGLTFSAGKWIGQDSWIIAWAIHAVGVVLADYFGQMGGGLVAFPLFHAVSIEVFLTVDTTTSLWGFPTCSYQLVAYVKLIFIQF